MTYGRAILVLLAFAATASAQQQQQQQQMTFDQAQRRLRERLATRPASTRPATEEDRLRQENTRLREENFTLRQEVHSLREALAHGAEHQPGTAATRPAGGGEGGGGGGGGGGGAEALIGKWRGGNVANQTAFVSQFNPDGTYRQTWASPERTETGKFRLGADDTVEMWTDRTPDNAPHSRWRVSVENNGGSLALVPVGPDGTVAPGANALILKREP